MAALLAVFASVGCGPERASSPDTVGDVALALVLPGGAVVNTVNYAITGNGITPIAGTIDVSAPGTTAATVLVSGLAEGGYTVAMNATASDGQSCSASMPFTVVRGQTAMANVILRCSRTSTTGTVAIGGRLDQCPFITGFSATSLQAPVGSNILVAVAATDRDGDAIAYSWTNGTPATGSLTSTNGLATLFHCAAAGTTELSVAISDGVCGDSWTNAIPLTCTAATAVDGGAPFGCAVGDRPSMTTIADFESADAGRPVIQNSGTFAFGEPVAVDVVENGGWHLTWTGNQFAGVGIGFSGSTPGTCVDATGYDGVQFDVSGSAGCAMDFIIGDSEHTLAIGGELGSGSFDTYGPTAPFTVGPTARTIQVPFTGMGMPTGGTAPNGIDQAKLLSVGWGWSAPASATCAVDVVIDNVRFYGGSGSATP